MACEWVATRCEYTLLLKLDCMDLTVSKMRLIELRFDVCVRAGTTWIRSENLRTQCASLHNKVDFYSVTRVDVWYPWLGDAYTR